jgi:class 3 adenylate cyclase
MTATRRLAAILAADVAGYSRLIGADEEGTLNQLRSIRTDVIEPKISLLGVAAQIGKRQHRDRRLVGQSEGRCDFGWIFG